MVGYIEDLNDHWNARRNSTAVTYAMGQKLSIDFSDGHYLEIGRIYHVIAWSVLGMGLVFQAWSVFQQANDKQ